MFDPELMTDIERESRQRARTWRALLALLAIFWGAVSWLIAGALAWTN